MASARLYRGMHHLSDVAVAMVNGVLAGLLAWNWLRREPAGDTTTADEHAGMAAAHRG